MRSPLLEKIPTIIKTMVADDNMLYVGTSQGMVVAVPIDSLSGKDQTVKPDSKDGASVGINSAHLDNCALALHVQKDSRVKSLLYLQLPLQHRDHPQGDRVTDDSPASAESQLQHALPNIPLEGQELSDGDATSAPLSGGYRSLIVSAGKGHMEYSADKNAEDMLRLPPDYNSLREKNEEHQLLVWGHKL